MKKEQENDKYLCKCKNLFFPMTNESKNYKISMDFNNCRLNSYGNYNIEVSER